MNLPNGATVAVVDGEKLVLFKHSGAGAANLTAIEAPAVDHQASSSTGHASSSANPDNNTQAEDGFAAGVAEMLNTWSLGGKLTDLLVIAAPKTLGELRKHWRKELSAKLIGEIPKDLTGRSASEIGQAIDAA